MIGYLLPDEASVPRLSAEARKSSSKCEDRSVVSCEHRALVTLDDGEYCKMTAESYL